MKVNKLEKNGKRQNVREMYKVINEFKKGYQPHIYVIKKDDFTIVADKSSILNRWKQFYKNLLNVHQSSFLERSEIYTAGPDIPEPCLLEKKVTKEKLKKSKLSRVDLN